MYALSMAGARVFQLSVPILFFEVFWQGEEKLGSEIRCPRDGRPGCALVDWLSPEHRQMQTHFMPLGQCGKKATRSGQVGRGLKF